MALDDGAPLHWRSLGQGPKNALALHCSLGHGGTWRALLPALGDDLTIEAPDMPGHGRSPAYDGVSSTGELVLSAVLQKITEPVHVIGHSFGALCGLRVAQLRPDLVSSLTLYEPVLYAACRDRNRAVFDQDVRRIEEVNDLARQGQSTAAAKLFLSDWGDGQAWDALPDKARDGFAARIPFIAGSHDYVVRDVPDIFGKLESISAPSTIVFGERSPRIMREVCSEVAERIPVAQLVALPEADHMGAISHPEIFATHIKRTLDRA